MKYFSKIAIVSAVVACVLGVVVYVKSNTAVINSWRKPIGLPMG